MLRHLLDGRDEIFLQRFAMETGVFQLGINDGEPPIHLCKFSVYLGKVSADLRLQILLHGSDVL